MNSSQLILDSFNKEPNKAYNYYLVSVKHQENESLASFYSAWVRTDINKREERRIDCIKPRNAIEKFEIARQSLGVIDKGTELSAALRLGGHFLINSAIMEKHWSEILKPRIVVFSYDKGCLDYEMLTKRYRNRYARGKTRAEVIDRDGYRCRVCGKSPDDERYLNLEVHHIKPWEEGGLTEPTNLITLCNICHEGVKCYDRQVLYKKIGISFPEQNHMIYDPSCYSLDGIISNSVVFSIKNRKIK